MSIIYIFINVSIMHVCPDLISGRDKSALTPYIKSQHGGCAILSTKRLRVFFSFGRFFLHRGCVIFWQKKIVFQLKTKQLNGIWIYILIAHYSLMLFSLCNLFMWIFTMFRSRPEPVNPGRQIKQLWHKLKEYSLS